jgi:hypothetical protein
MDTDREFHLIVINNNPPVLINPGNQQYTTNTGNQDLQLSATDVDNDLITYTKVSGDANITISTSGLMTTDTDALSPGTYPVTARADDGTDTDDESFNVVVFAPDPLPEFGMIS